MDWILPRAKTVDPAGSDVVRCRAMRKLAFALGVFFVAFGLGACSSDKGKSHDLFQPKPECAGAAVMPYMGTNLQVISKLAIGSKEDGFDLDGDGMPDNKLSAVSSIAQSAIDDSFKNYEIVIPIELFDLDSPQNDSCVKFAVYLGAYVKDADNDGKKPLIHGGDCNDHDANIHPGATEIVGNFKDDDCDGKADDVGGTPSNDTADTDKDGVTIKDGDCDDTDPMVKPGLAEICGDGKDNDCDGVADRTMNADGTSSACNPFEKTAMVPLDKLSFDPGGAPVIQFTSGTITNGVLEAGPSLFSVNIPVTNGITLDLKISGASIKGDVVMENGAAVIKNGHLGGVIDAKTADTIRGLNISQIGLTPEDSLLDATFANLLGPLLALPKATDKVLKKYAGCRTPDIDVDGDGLEAFCDSDPNNDPKTVDICIDGDGTEVKDVVGGDGTVMMQCTEAQKNGKDRFVDGISVELNFETTAISKITPPSQ
jgi:putative metal-binding protein